MGKGKQQHTRSRKKAPVVRDKHLLYSAAVQSVDVDVDFFQRVYKKTHGEKFRRLREDFCGTAALACEFVGRHEANEAWGIDLDKPTLDWGRRNYVRHLGPAAARLHLVRSNVLEVHRPKVQVVVAQNFSFFVFKSRELLGRYFRQVRQSLEPGGIFFVDALGGTEATQPLRERRRIPSSKAVNGVKVPPFVYIWEQTRFNPIDADLQCRIHFRLADGTRMRNVFSYDWRMWTLPELRELMSEAGFKTVEVYTEGWDDDADDTDGIFRRRNRIDNDSAWIAYVIGKT